MTVDFWLKQGNTLPVFVAMPTSAGQPIASVPAGTTARIRVKSKPTQDSGGVGLIVNNLPATILTTTDSHGNPAIKLQYAFTALQSAVPGVYYAEMDLLFASGDIQTFPDDGSYSVIVITPVLA